MTDFIKQRQNMVDRQLRKRGIADKRVLQAMNKVPRHEFVNESQRSLAYYDGPLPIGHDQTISQPYIVAFMTEALKLKPTHKVLEIGTGCGYQTAILSLLAGKVISLEHIKELADNAKIILNKMEYQNISIHNTNGMNGWETDAPFDRIIGTAAPKQIPNKLIEQLKPNGIMILPVGKNLFDQYLYVVKKNKLGAVKTMRSFAVRFVPMV